MKIQRFTIHCALLLLPVLLIASFATADDKKKDSNDVCANPNPASLCSADNTCGSAFCSVYCEHQADRILVLCHPEHSRGEGERSFLRPGWNHGDLAIHDKGTGFLVDPGKSSPFDPPGVITGGSEKSVRARQIGTTPNRSRWASMKAQISGAAGRAPARKNPPPPTGSRSSAPAR